MIFTDALKLMKQGEKVKLPSWGGYWYWDEEKQTVVIHTKDGNEFDIVERCTIFGGSFNKIPPSQ